jgi:hypothetical protein
VREHKGARSIAARLPKVGLGPVSGQADVTRRGRRAELSRCAQEMLRQPAPHVERSHAQPFQLPASRGGTKMADSCPGLSGSARPNRAYGGMAWLIDPAPNRGDRVFVSRKFEEDYATQGTGRPLLTDLQSVHPRALSRVIHLEGRAPCRDREGAGAARVGSAGARNRSRSRR